MELQATTASKNKLYLVLLGSKAARRNVEQHDYFFGIGNSIKDLVPQMKVFWPEAGASLHVDGWREVTAVEGYRIEVIEKDTESDLSGPQLFFINLGGYLSGKLIEQHHIILSVKDDRAMAIQDAKKTLFYKTNSIKGANSHIDEKYGVDVDEIYKIEEILDPALKSKFRIKITQADALEEDKIELGYFKLDKLK